MKGIKQRNKFFYIALLISFVLHLSILSIKHISKDIELAEQKQKAVQVKIISKQELNKLKNTYKKKRLIKELQIVNNDSKKEEKKPIDTRFLGRKNQSYSRQTTARKIDIYKEAGKGKKDGLNKKKDKKMVKTKRKNHFAKPLKNKKFSLADFSINKPLKNIKKYKRSPAAVLGLKNGNKAKSGLSQNNDYLEDVPLGDFTKLNTVEYKYFGFYHRIRQKLEQYWGATLRQKAEKLFRQGRKIASNTDLLTSLLITLDDKGNIIDVIVKGTSGIREIDSAAIESFNRAGPFPNPPKGMLKNGKAIIRWGFVVKS